MKKNIKYLLAILLSFGLIVGVSSYFKVFGSVVSEETAIYVSKTDNYNQLKDKLKIAKILKDEIIFDALAKQMKVPEKLNAGKYVFKPGDSTLDVLKKFRGNRQSTVRLVINNINFKQDLAGKISHQLDIDSLEFFNFLNDDALLKEKGFNKDNIMCVFIPNTYEMYWATSLDKFLEKMQKEHDLFWTEDRKAKARAKGLTTNEIFILASIVEKEYKFSSERPRIAGVYLNRLRINMPLQADPTCKFAWGDLSLKRIFSVHTQNPHPYNTYFVYGLPPGPICLPETSTINDVLNAETHNYLYFCAHADLDGKHEFNTNFDDHMKAARLYQKALNKLNIY